MTSFKRKSSSAQSQNDLIANERDLLNAQASSTVRSDESARRSFRRTRSSCRPRSPTPRRSNRSRWRIGRSSRRSSSSSSANRPRQSSRRNSGFPTCRSPSRKTTRPPGRRSSRPESRSRSPYSTGSIRAATSRCRNTPSPSSPRPPRHARAVTQDVRAAYANASTAMRQVTFLRDQLVPSAREAYASPPRATDSAALGARCDHRPYRLWQCGSPTRRCPRGGEHGPGRSRSRAGLSTTAQGRSPMKTRLYAESFPQPAHRLIRRRLFLERCGGTSAGDTSLGPKPRNLVVTAEQRQRITSSR